MKDTEKSAESTTASGKFQGFTDEERAAMKDRAQELKAAARRAATEARIGALVEKALS